MRLFSFGGYGLALAALALVFFGAYDSYPYILHMQSGRKMLPRFDFNCAADLNSKYHLKAINALDCTPKDVLFMSYA